MEKDWKLFRKKLGSWQEAYMDKLIEEYKDILNYKMVPIRRTTT